MLNPDFWGQPIDTAERERIFREELHLDPSRFTLILATGANGANNHISTLDRFSDAQVHPQVIALCGKNEKARRNIEAWAQSHQQIPVCALGYQTRMRRIMECADAIFARPGTGTTSEAILAGLPIIFNGIGGVMPQEIITTRYCAKFFESNIIRRAADLPVLIRAWMSDAARVQAIREGVVKARPAGKHPVDILERLTRIVSAR
jgi:processive 1,2-diacylglycerol beta-glucosyltransferase